MSILLVAQDEAACRAWLAAAPDVRVLAGSEPASAPPDVIVMQVASLRPEDVPTVARLSARYPRSRVLVLSQNDSPEPLVIAVFRCGAWGYLVAPPGQDQTAPVIDAIRTISRGGAVINPRLTGQMLDEIRQVQHLRSGPP